jgi:hypothetical protein
MGLGKVESALASDADINALKQEIMQLKGLNESKVVC